MLNWVADFLEDRGRARLSAVDLEDFLGMVTAAAPASAQLVVTCNLDHLRMLDEDAGFRSAYEAASIITLDGFPVALLHRVLSGRRIARISGADAILEILPRLEAGRHRPFFVCSGVDVGSALVRGLTDRGFPAEAAAYDCPPIGFERSEHLSHGILAAIRRHGATHLFLGVGAPKSEIWTQRHLAAIGGAWIFCFGAGLDFAAGTKRRAPAWVRALYLEWLFRALQDPARLAARYGKDAAFLCTRILPHALKQALRRGTRARDEM